MNQTAAYTINAAPATCSKVQDHESLAFQQASVLTTIVKKVSEFFIRFKIEQVQAQARDRMNRKQQMEMKLYRDGLELPLEEKLKLGMYRNMY